MLFKPVDEWYWERLVDDFVRLHDEQPAMVNTIGYDI